MIAVLLIVGACIGYVVTAGAWGGTVLRINKARCRDCSARGYCPSDHVTAATLLGALWPLTLPASLGVHMASRDDRRQERELAEAKHRRAIAEERAKEAAAVERQYQNLMRGVA